MTTDKYGFRNLIFCDTHSELVDKMCKAGGDLKLFDSMYELFSLAACIGYHNKKKVPVQKTGKSIEFNQFRSFENFDGIFLAICLGHEKDAKILNDTDDEITLRLSIFSEYANGGMEIIKSEVVSRSGILLENFIHYIKENGDNFKVSEAPTGIETNKFKHLLDGLGS